jgi:hypothetical protein
MTMVYCRACGKSLDAAVPNCPHCGASQIPAATVSAGLGLSTQRLTDYAQVPWYRRRWFVLLSLVLVSPVAGLLAATGELYYQGGDGAVKLMTDSIKSLKLRLYLFSFAFGIGLVVTQSTLSNLIYTAITMLMALIWGLKK